MAKEWEQSGLPVLRWELTSAFPTRSRLQAGKAEVTGAAGLKKQPNHMQSYIVEGTENSERQKMCVWKVYRHTDINTCCHHLQNTEHWRHVFGGHCLQLWVQNLQMHLRPQPMTCDFPEGRERESQACLWIRQHLKQRKSPFPYFLLIRKVISHRHSKHRPTAQLHHYTVLAYFCLKQKTATKNTGFK